MGSENRLSWPRNHVNNGGLTEVFVRFEKQIINAFARHFGRLNAYICHRDGNTVKAMNFRRQSKRVKSQGDQSSHTENPLIISPEDEPLVEDFCYLVATIVVRILAFEGQEVYNCSSSDEKGASKL